ncbi:hypothetical protein JAAARDRAFT_425687 [Jaapia argillacea MUCL 33604]|uniref:Uncharacterized protein n=1 Tax=Jaapia argillacea MUCL 33604 TaxID=933084 RepID=A0A067PQA2_9AGAM|nr:hypothetical protein JAAARDRAFT_425687 [Jaapia argillacea MUCL 33604]
MCNLETEGTKYGCGHYVVTRKVRKIDCRSQYCINSVKHSNPCPGCQCERYFGPDAKETVTAVSKEYCDQCHYWYRGAGAQRR